MIQLAIISMLIFFVSCGTVDRIGKTAIEEYNFYLKAKKEARAKEIAKLAKEDLDQDSEETAAQPPPKIPQRPKDESCKFSFLKLRRVCN